ncbi:MAG: replication initiation protein [Rubrivivax sp.]|nr:MAG: replication initiation protein [Rubrivivax sp.]
MAIACLPSIGAAESRCFGTVANGRIADSIRLPLSGPNFSAYSTIAAGAGRTYVHSSVARIVERSYRTLETALPGTVFVYGETGLADGGRFKPHRTHQNGTSVDFFVLVRNGQDRSVPLPTPVTQRFGYDIEFDKEARQGEYRIDFEAMAEHLYQLDVAAKAEGTGIAQVIFDRAYLPKLFATKRGPWLEKHLSFMRSKPWVRHDEHYHVDFAIRCKAASTAPRS